MLLVGRSLGPHEKRLDLAQEPGGGSRRFDHCVRTNEEVPGVMQCDLELPRVLSSPVSFFDQKTKRRYVRSDVTAKRLSDVDGFECSFSGHAPDARSMTTRTQSVRSYRRPA